MLSSHIHAAAGSPAGGGPGAPVRLRELRKDYGSVTAVAGIDLEIRAGEFVTLLGPSGSGKTTTLMLIAGFQTPTSGEIWLRDREISQLAPNKRGIGMVFQHYALFPHLRVADNVAYPLKMRGVAKAEIDRRVGVALDRVRLGGYGDRFPRQLSGGQQQRVALARAFVFEPTLVLMDEPLGALDRRLREEMQLEIKALQSDLGFTVVYVTHDQEEALVMSDRIAVMSHGVIDQCAPPETLYAEPSTPFVATFVGESNAIEGRVGDRGADPTTTVVTTDAGCGLEGIANDALPAGSPVVATIRPEKLRIGTASDAASGVNALDATCREYVFTGEIRRYVVDTPVGPLRLRVQNRPDAPVIAVGDRLRLTWEAADLRVFPRP
jgi:spermidine/putrescine ABC transporter ATP-binding subunit